MFVFNVGDRVKVISRCKTNSATGVVLSIDRLSRLAHVKLDKRHISLNDIANREGLTYAMRSLELIEKAETPEVKSDKFWMVVGDGSPSLRHTSKESADTEAERLAKANPGVEFFVLESVSSVKAVGVVKRTL